MNDAQPDPRYPIREIEPDPNFTAEQLAIFHEVMAGVPDGHFFPNDRADIWAYCRVVTEIADENAVLATEPTVFVNERTKGRKSNPRVAQIRQMENHRMKLADRLQLVPYERMNGRREKPPTPQSATPLSEVDPHAPGLTLVDLMPTREKILAEEAKRKGAGSGNEPTTD